MIEVRYGRKTFSTERESTVRRLLKRLKIDPEGVIVAVNGQLVTSDERIVAGDEVEIVRAISGGAA